MKSNSLTVAATLREEEASSHDNVVEEGEEEQKESEDVEMDEPSVLIFDEGDYAMNEDARDEDGQEKDEEAERSDDPCLVIDSSRDADHSQQVRLTFLYLILILIEGSFSIQCVNRVREDCFDLRRFNFCSMYP